MMRYYERVNENKETAKIKSKKSDIKTNLYLEGIRNKINTKYKTQRRKEEQT